VIGLQRQNKVVIDWREKSSNAANIAFALERRRELDLGEPKTGRLKI
jgi:hypothetical protein